MKRQQQLELERNRPTDEEVFVLREQDVTSPIAILYWIILNVYNTDCSDEKLTEAFQCALQMRNSERARPAD